MDKSKQGRFRVGSNNIHALVTTQSIVKKTLGREIRLCEYKRRLRFLEERYETWNRLIKAEQVWYDRTARRVYACDAR